MIRTGGEGIRKIGIGVGAEVGQILGVGMGLIEEKLKMIDGIAVDMSLIMGRGKVGIVREEAVIVASLVLIDTIEIVCHQVIGKARK